MEHTVHLVHFVHHILHRNWHLKISAGKKLQATFGRTEGLPDRDD
jgi:hypothetical protein